MNINRLFNLTENADDLYSRITEAENCLESYLLPEISLIIGEYLKPYSIDSQAFKSLKKRIGSSLRKEATKGLSKEAKKLISMKLMIKHTPNYYILILKMDIKHYSIEATKAPLLIISRVNLKCIEYLFFKYRFSEPPIYDDLHIRDMMYCVRNSKNFIETLTQKRLELLTIMSIED